jgi:thioredoxin 1
MAGAHTLTFTDDNFEEDVLQSEQPVLVDFWAEWCGPCKALSPTIDELAEEYSGRIRIGKLDTDANRDASVRFQVSAIPTLILFRRGEVVERLLGLQSKTKLKHALDALLG